MKTWLAGLILKVGTLLFDLIVGKITKLIADYRSKAERRATDKKNEEKLKEDIKKDGVSDEQISKDAEDLLNGR